MRLHCWCHCAVDCLPSTITSEQDTEPYAEALAVGAVGIRGAAEAFECRVGDGGAESLQVSLSGLKGGSTSSDDALWPTESSESVAENLELK
jgi:hypothetical protein